MDYAIPNYRCLAPNLFYWMWVVQLLLHRTLSPQLLFELFIHIEDDGADGAVRESLIGPEDKIFFVQMWIRATVTRPMVVNRTEIILQKGTWLVHKN
jgi:hypothetical protein